MSPVPKGYCSNAQDLKHNFNYLDSLTIEVQVLAFNRDWRPLTTMLMSGRKSASY